VEVPAASVAEAPAEQKVLEAPVREAPAPEVKAPAPPPPPPPQAAPPEAPALEARAAPQGEQQHALSRRANVADKRAESTPPKAAMDETPAAAAAPAEVREYAAPIAKQGYGATSPRGAAPEPAPEPAPAPAPSAASRARIDGIESERVEVTGSRIKRDSSQWLADIEQLLKDGQFAKARHEWHSFRVQNPHHKVAPELEAKLEALEKP